MSDLDLDGGDLADLEPKTTPGRAAVIEDGVVTNLIVVDVKEGGTTDFDLPGCRIMVIPGDSPVQHGWTYDAGNFSEPKE